MWRQYEERTVAEIPDTYKMLVRTVIRQFYEITDGFIIDILVRLNCLSEAELCNILKFEPKQLKSCLNKLCLEKILKTQFKMIPGPDGRNQKICYYAINYLAVAKCALYRLHEMQNLILNKERNSNHISNYTCSNCSNMFTDLNMDEIYDFADDLLRCTYCKSIIVEDKNQPNQSNNWFKLRKFHAHFLELFKFLEETQYIETHEPSMSKQSEFNVSENLHSSIAYNISINFTNTDSDTESDKEDERTLPTWLMGQVDDCSKSKKRKLIEKKMNHTTEEESQSDIFKLVKKYDVKYTRENFTST